MDGYIRRRSSPVRSRYLRLEPLEDRYLLSTLLTSTSGLAAPTVSAQSNAVDMRATAGTALGTPVVVSGSLPASGGASPNSATTLIDARQTSQPANDSAPNASSVSQHTAGTSAPASDDDSQPISRRGEAGASGQTSSHGGANSPSVNQRTATSGRARDRDDDADNDDDDDDDDDDGPSAREYEEASEVRTATEASTVRTDDGPEESEFREESAANIEAGEGQEESAAPPALAKPAMAAEPVATEKATLATAQAEGVEFRDPPPGTVSAKVPCSSPLPSAETTSALEDQILLVLSRTAAPSAGEIGLDLRLIEKGLDSFFARLSSLGTESGGRSLTTGMASWLTAVAAASLQIARSRDKTRRSSLAMARTAMLGSTAAEGRA